MNYTIEHIEELRRCSEDVEYFIDSYVKIDHPTRGGAVQLILNDFQREVIRSLKMRRKVFIPGDRRSGKTTVGAAIALHQMVFNTNKNYAIVTINHRVSIHITRMLYNMCSRLSADFFGFEVATRNATKIGFANGCTTIVTNRPANDLHSMTLDSVYIDESEWVDDIYRVTSELVLQMSPSPCSTILALSSVRTADAFASVDRGG